MQIDEQLALWLGGACSGAIFWLAKITWNLSQLSRKVDTMWQFQLRRAGAEAVQRGMARMNSPVVVTEEAKGWLGDIAVPLRQLYAKVGRHVSDAELSLEIERRFGEEIVKKALAVAKGQ